MTLTRRMAASVSNGIFFQEADYLRQSMSLTAVPPFFLANTAGKRKSAVELLQETKAFYVKSETVLDRKQELKNSGHLQVSQLSAPGAPPRLLRKCTGNSSTCPMQPTSPSQLPTPLTPPCCWASCHEQDRRKSSVTRRLIHKPEETNAQCRCMSMI